MHTSFIATKDYPSLVRLLDVLARQEGQTCMITADIFRQLDADDAFTMLNFGAYEKDTLIGAACCYVGYDVLSASKGLHISDVIVSKNDRRHGVGQALMQEMARFSLNTDLRWMSWTCSPDNDVAKAFYHACGAVEPDATFMAMGHSAMTSLAGAM